MTESKKPYEGKVELKLVLVGDTAVGKTCMIQSFLHNVFTELYEPTVLDMYKGKKTLKLGTDREISYDLEMHDTAGDEHLGQKRSIVYHGTDVFMICVAKDSITSF